jgi:hypothetical protein
MSVCANITGPLTGFCPCCGAATEEKCTCKPSAQTEAANVVEATHIRVSTKTVHKEKVFRRKLYKNQSAKQGEIFLVLHVYVKTGKATIGKLVQGNLGEKFEKFIVAEMRKEIYRTYKL